MLAPCILVVDDEALIHLMLEADLTDAGFTVIVENSVDDALARLEASGSNCQALVTDINLGKDRSGWDIARHARELNPHIPVVYMTGDSAQDWPIQGVPGSVLVCKPFASVQIVNAVAQLITDTPATPPA